MIVDRLWADRDLQGPKGLASESRRLVPVADRGTKGPRGTSVTQIHMSIDELANDACIQPVYGCLVETKRRNRLS